MKIILASDSPRRKDILKSSGIEFTTISHAFDESDISFSNPEEFVKECALKKAISVVDKFNEDLIIGCDTIVYCDNKIIGKPINYDDAYSIIKTLSGKIHFVYSGISMLYKGANHVESVKTSVEFYRLEDEEIKTYLEKANYLDKAGAYAIQEQASMFIKNIEGDYFNIVGFPLTRFRDMFYNVTKRKYYEFIY